MKENSQILSDRIIALKDGIGSCTITPVDLADAAELAQDFKDLMRETAMLRTTVAKELVMISDFIDPRTAEQAGKTAAGMSEAESLISLAKSEIDCIGAGALDQMVHENGCLSQFSKLFPLLTKWLEKYAE